MEFFRNLKATASAEELTHTLTLERMPELCASVASVTMTGPQECMATTVWGEFAIRREEIMGGVRFYMPGCPNCLGWTITTDLPPDPDSIVIHCAINRLGHDPDFIASLEDFAEEWKEGLEAAFGAEASQTRTNVSQSRPNLPGGT